MGFAASVRSLSTDAGAWETPRPAATNAVRVVLDPRTACIRARSRAPRVLPKSSMTTAGGASFLSRARSSRSMSILRAHADLFRPRAASTPSAVVGCSSWSSASGDSRDPPFEASSRSFAQSAHSRALHVSRRRTRSRTGNPRQRGEGHRVAYLRDVRARADARGRILTNTKELCSRPKASRISAATACCTAGSGVTPYFLRFGTVASETLRAALLATAKNSPLLSRNLTCW